MAWNFIYLEILVYIRIYKFSRGLLLERNRDKWLIGSIRRWWISLLLLVKKIWQSDLLKLHFLWISLVHSDLEWRQLFINFSCCTLHVLYTLKYLINHLSNSPGAFSTIRVSYRLAVVHFWRRHLYIYKGIHLFFIVTTYSLVTALIFLKGLCPRMSFTQNFWWKWTGNGKIVRILYRPPISIFSCCVLIFVCAFSSGEDVSKLEEIFGWAGGTVFEISP